MEATAYIANSDKECLTNNWRRFHVDPGTEWDLYHKNRRLSSKKKDRIIIQRIIPLAINIGEGMIDEDLTKVGGCSWLFVNTSVNINPELVKKFNDLASKWKEETGLYSLSIDKINMTYLKIIALGENIIPLILKDMESPNGVAHWRIALEALTGVNPISKEDLGKNKIIKEKWIEWGKDNRII